MDKGIIYSALSALLYGSIGYFGHCLMAAGLTMNNMLLWRFAIATILLYLTQCFLKQKKLTNFFTDTPSRNMLILGGVFYSSCTILYFVAAKTIGTGLAMVIFFSCPIFVILISWYLNRKKISTHTLFALTLIFLGCTLISFKEDVRFDLAGVVCCLLSAMTYAIFVIGSKKYAGDIDPVTSALLICLGNTIVFGFLCLVTGELFQFHANLLIWIALVLFAVTATILPIILLATGLQYISANKASVISVLEPVVSILLGVFLLSEDMRLIQVVGSILILGSAIIIAFDKQA